MSIHLCKVARCIPSNRAASDIEYCAISNMRHGVAYVKRINLGRMNRPSSGYHDGKDIPLSVQFEDSRMESPRSRVRQELESDVSNPPDVPSPAQNAAVRRIRKRAIPLFAGYFLGHLQAYGGGNGGNRHGWRTVIRAAFVNAASWGRTAILVLEARRETA